MKRAAAGAFKSEDDEMSLIINGKHKVRSEFIFLLCGSKTLLLPETITTGYRDRLISKSLKFDLIYISLRRRNTKQRKTQKRVKYSTVNGIERVRFTFLFRKLFIESDTAHVFHAVLDAKYESGRRPF